MVILSQQLTVADTATGTVTLTKLDRPIQNLTFWIDSFGRNLTGTWTVKLRGIQPTSGTGTFAGAQAMTPVFTLASILPPSQGRDSNSRDLAYPAYDITLDYHNTVGGGAVSVIYVTILGQPLPLFL